MNRQKILKATRGYLRKKFKQEGTGHDWWHIDRVVKMALSIGRQEKADLFIVELGALLHDIADFKFHGGDDTLGPKRSAQWLKSLGVDAETIERVRHIVENVSFKGAGVKSAMKSLEGKVVQDADRLDGIGAIGIARVFAYGGHRGRPIYEPGIKPIFHKNFAHYKKGSSSSISHFYEKLLYVKGMMNTKAAKRIAVQRHAFVLLYLRRFFAEWQGKK